MNTFGVTDKGKVRKDNQDSFLIEPFEGEECLTAALCDGMGGAKAGNIASDLAVKTFVSQVRERLAKSQSKRPDYKVILQRACEEANNMVFGYSCFDDVFTGMGTTLVAALFVNGDINVINVGDSRAYKLSKSRIVQITRDHSLVQELLDKGAITPEEAKDHPRKNVITRALGVDAKVTSDVFSVKLQRGERLLLCSDGLTNMVEDGEILDLAKHNAELPALGQALMDTAIQRGARDNVTIVLVSK